jgi:hypothetical protein
VVLLIDNTKVLVMGVSATQELQKSPPLNSAATTSKSLEVQEVLAGGKVCAKDIDVLRKQNIKNANSFLEIVDFDFIQI